MFAVMKDVDSRPGRGASFGDGMARLHQRLGAVGAVVDGTVRDLEGIRRVGLPIFAWGTVPGHGVFNATRVNAPITVGSVRIRPGDLIFGDGDGCVRIPLEHARKYWNWPQKCGTRRPRFSHCTIQTTFPSPSGENRAGRGNSWSCPHPAQRRTLWRPPR